MRILQLRLQNLNSLVGEWSIDFTRPEFVSEGIFAVTGPTGAGKSTLLDALCLALYGRTPRLGDITGASNEIMSRHTGECAAEVCFETPKGRFRCVWRQNRARKRPDGNLQPVDRTFAEADTGRILETKASLINACVEEVTGLDFDRFTRSMLLAQGGFAAFLHASPEDRTKMLENLTGTDIYSVISRQTHLRHKEEKERLQGLRETLLIHPPLPDDEEQRLRADLARQQQEEQLCCALRDQSAARLQQARHLSRLRAERQDVDRQTAELAERDAAFATRRRQLRLAEQALELMADHAALQAIRAAQKADLQQVEALTRALPPLLAAESTARLALNTAETAHAEAQKQQQAALPGLRRAHELDTQLAEKNVHIATAHSNLEAARNELTGLQTAQQTDTDALARCAQSLAALQQEKLARACDESLPEVLPALLERVETLHRRHDQTLAAIRAAHAARAGRRQTLAAHETALRQAETARTAENQARAALLSQQASLKNLLSHRDVSQWRQDQLRLGEERQRLLRLHELITALDASRHAATTLQNTGALLAARLDVLDKRLASRQSVLLALEHEQEQQDARHEHLRRAHTFAEARAQLHPGDPCPLCGAPDHPYVAAAPHKPLSLPRAHPQKVRNAAKRVANVISALQQTRVALHKDREATAAALAAQDDARTRSLQALQELAPPASESLTPHMLNALDTPESTAAALSDIVAQGRAAAEKLAKADTVLRQAEDAQKLETTLRETLDKAVALAQTAQQAVHAAALQRQADDALVLRLQDERKAAVADVRTLRRTLRETLRPFGCTLSRSAHLAQFLDQLTSRRDRWRALNLDLSTQEHLHAELTARTSQRAQQIAETAARAEILHRQHALLVEAQTLLHTERVTHFPGDPLAEETRLAAAAAQALSALTAARSGLGDADQALLRHRLAETALQDSLSQRAPLLQATEAAFIARLLASSFPDEPSFLAACLPEDSRRALTALDQALVRDADTLSARRVTLQNDLDAALAAVSADTENTPAPLDEDALALEVTARNAALADIQKAVGALQQRLADNEATKLQQASQLLAVSAQERELLRWARLDRLIGSADGKKYRNFVQVLTFDAVIHRANQQLQRMTDRYLLVRDLQQPLALNVIDSYQGGEIRTTRNLSGGESFLISLALALGLARMSSRNVRVDSLFLDEGFGALDDDTLDAALDTLASLREEGKLIGIISHVPAIRQRIATQIHLIPLPGGRSILQG